MKSTDHECEPTGVKPPQRGQMVTRTPKLFGNKVLMKDHVGKKVLEWKWDLQNAKKAQRQKLGMAT